MLALELEDQQWGIFPQLCTKQDKSHQENALS